MTIEQHVEELRAELSANDDVAERRQIEAELQAAIAEYGQLERVLRAEMQRLD